MCIYSDMLCSLNIFCSTFWKESNVLFTHTGADERLLVHDCLWACQFIFDTTLLYWSCTNYLTRHSQAFHGPLYDSLQYVMKNWTVGKPQQETISIPIWMHNCCLGSSFVQGTKRCRHGYRNRGASGACAPPSFGLCHAHSYVLYYKLILLKTIPPTNWM